MRKCGAWIQLTRAVLDPRSVDGFRRFFVRLISIRWHRVPEFLVQNVPFPGDFEESIASIDDMLI